MEIGMMMSSRRVASVPASHAAAARRFIMYFKHHFASPCVCMCVCACESYLCVSYVRARVR